MELLRDFIEAKRVEKSKIFPHLKCTQEEATILQLLTKKYISGVDEVNVYDLLSEISDLVPFLFGSGSNPRQADRAWFGGIPQVHSDSAAPLHRPNLIWLHDNLKAKLFNQGSLVEVSLNRLHFSILDCDEVGSRQSDRATRWRSACATARAMCCSV